MLRLPGQGGWRAAGGAPEDLFVRVRIRPSGKPGVRIGRLAAIAVVALSLVVALVALLRSGQSDESGTAQPAVLPPVASPSAPASAVPATTRPAALSPSRYQAALNALDAAVAGRIERVRAARTPGALSTALARLEQSVRGQTSKLRSLAPPVAVSAEHVRVVRALDTLGSDVAGLQAAAEAAAVCIGSAGTASIGRSEGAAEARAAAARLAAADRAHRYHVGAFLPQKTRAATRRLRNGTLVKRPNGGHGELSIDNGGSADAVISLVRVRAKKPSMTVYVRAGDSFTVRRISNGTYRIYMTTGADWDKTARLFSRDCSFEAFDEPAEFTTRTTSTAIQYTVHEITVTPVAGGNATTSGVDPGAFPVP